MKTHISLIIALLFAATAQAQMEHHSHKMIALTCMPNEHLNLTTAMCDPVPTAGEDVTRIMEHGNIFLTGITQSGPRGRDGFAAPNMLMANAGSNFGGRHFLDLGVMMTGELWTFPRAGYPLLLQTGEHNLDGQPYIDAQHPHSSPIMGLTASDTVQLNENSVFTLSFSPRGQSTEGPIAFMHRPTGMLNPDAPLGHHIGQDVGHISSTVLAASLGWRQWFFEASTFSGREPEPNKVDLPMYPMNSTAGRVGYRLSNRALLLASLAYVKAPEDGVDFYRRHSASLYTSYPVGGGWEWLNSLIYGHVQNYDLVRNLTSVAEEFALARGPSNVWGRLEVLERTGTQVGINSEVPHWVNVATLGYTHALYENSGVEFKAGASYSKYFLPEEFRAEYGREPWSGRVFLQISGMGMQ